ncbi:hypothetical protein DFH08DRAFT_1032773, partial [Mycena albidolilacea]
MFSAIFKSSASAFPIPAVFWAVASAISLSITSINLESSKSAFLVSAKPTGVYTIPSPTVLAQDNIGLFSSFILVLSVTIIILASGSWIRSPRLGARLKREATPPPPPPPPTPPTPLGPNAADINDGEEHDPEDNGGGDGDDPHVEDGGVDESKDADDDGLTTAAAPAPEDPPPPPGSVDEEDNDGDAVAAVTQGSLPWLFLLLLVSLAASRTPEITVKVDGAVPNPALRSPLSSVTIPGLLERLDDVVICKASSSIPQLLANPRIPPSLLDNIQARVALELDPPVPVVAPQQVSAVPVAAAVHVAAAIAVHVPAAVALPSPAPTIRQIGLVAWRKTFVLFAGIPGLVLLGGMFGLLLPLGSRSRRTENEALESEPPPLTPRMVPLPPSPPMTPRHVPLPLSPPTTPRRHRPPPAPPSSPISPRRQRPLAPLPFRDAATENICDNMVSLVKDKTARRILCKAEEKENVGRERCRRVSAVQREIWRCLYELRAGTTRKLDVKKWDGR